MQSISDQLAGKHHLPQTVCQFRLNTIFPKLYASSGSTPAAKQINVLN
jgi:hypothetical protein